MPNQPYFLKRSGEEETFGIDYTNRLTNEIVSAETISTSGWAISPSGLTNESATIDNSNRRATIRVSGGTSGTDYTLTNTVATSGGRTLVEEIIIRVRD